MPSRCDTMELQEVGGLEKKDDESWLDFVARLREMYSRPVFAAGHRYTMRRIDRIAAELSPVG